MSTTTQEDLFKCQPGKIKIIVLVESEKRKQLHQYLEQNYPQLNKSSLKVKIFNSERSHLRFKNCYECGNKRVHLNKYNYGVCPSNIDEYWSGICNKCYTSSYFEPNYDCQDDLFTIWKNNVIAIGDYFKGYQRRFFHESGDISQKDIENILIDVETYQVDPPPTQLNKMETSKHIADEILANLAISVYM